MPIKGVVLGKFDFAPLLALPLADKDTFLQPASAQYFAKIIDENLS
jgi:hypothetical protein